MGSQRVDWSRALCAALDLLEGARIFCGETRAGLLHRTARFPAADNHAEARGICPGCPLLSECLSVALREDGNTFRGLSPEERAVFGGARLKRARNRPVYLSTRDVLARVEHSGYDNEAVLRALAEHDGWLEDHPDPTVSRVAPAGWSKAWRDGAETFTQVWQRLTR